MAEKERKREKKERENGGDSSWDVLAHLYSWNVITTS